MHPDDEQQPEETSTLHTRHSEEPRITRRMTIETINTSNPFDVFLERVIIVMVGLPARGKSFLSKAIVRYLNFVGCPTALFNAGSVRRDMQLTGSDANFFDDGNKEAVALREKMAMMCLDRCLSYVSNHGPVGCRVAILDATNTTRARRRNVLQRCHEHVKNVDPSVTVLFLETLADDPVLLEQNYRMKLNNEDYATKDPEQALTDFRERVKKYEAVYEPVTDEEASEYPDFHYMKMFNAGQKLISYGVEGFLLRKIQRLIGSVHLRPHSIWIVLTAQTENCRKGVLGGDSDVSGEGHEYARAVAQVLREREECARKEDFTKHGKDEMSTVTIYTGTKKAYKSLAHSVMRKLESETYLLTLGYANEICAGDLDSKSVAELEFEHPDLMAARRLDKLNFRYPGVGGESYVDLVGRVNEVTCLLEQSQGNSIVICDRAVYRCIKGYFLGHSIQEIPFLDVEKGVLELRRNNKGFTAIQFPVFQGKCNGRL